MLSNTKYTDMKLSYNGNIFNEITGELLVTFSPSMTTYPYDKQNVTMTFGSASYTNDIVIITPQRKQFMVADPETFNVTNI